MSSFFTLQSPFLALPLTVAAAAASGALGAIVAPFTTALYFSVADAYFLVTMTLALRFLL